MMEENNKGKGFGIFYAVVGVATLVVAIIGATFAFFSATAQSKDVITGTTAEAAGLDLKVTPIIANGADMIPVNFDLNNTGEVDKTDQFVPAINGKCKDMNGNNVCSVYKITLKNKSKTSTIDIRGDLTLKNKSPELTVPTNMRWQLLNLTKGADTLPLGDNFNSTNVLEIPGHEVDATSVTVSTAKGELVRVGVDDAKEAGDAARKTLTKEATATYYVIIWLEEMGTDQGNADASKGFIGEVNFSAVDANGNSSGITASFSA